MNNKIKLIDVDASVFFSNTLGRYTISYNGSGGAIISDDNLSKCKKMFEEAMELAIVYKSIEDFQKGKSLTKINSFNYSTIKHVN